MIKELNLECPYKVFKDTENNVYFFDTDLDIRYIVYFTDANEYFENFHLRNNIYTFGFEPQDKVHSTKRTIRDNKIKLTLIAIIKRFFINTNNVLTFVADISDLKQKARNRLFDIWKNQHDVNQEFDKYDVEINTGEETYYSSMIIHKDNIHRSEYKKAFLLSTEELNK